ncbi:hypothetical protein GALMADRAFT_1127283 [Galerina marginata CBS 339.88]|uniref:Ricin B lectin domain-containing protein n=1 Tax=Galerina marginata (strain CBS 339.88) TaxID=685588 RepID=A0A067S8T3_GALM3|nr:hypothetical protein GALMADRAFT_1127283 [Galerina marginata CBS 339.88]
MSEFKMHSRDQPAPNLPQSTITTIWQEGKHINTRPTFNYLQYHQLAHSTLNIMSVTPGIYLIRNRKTGYYIVPNNDTSSGDAVTTIKIGDQVPKEAKLTVSVDQTGAYTIKSDSNLSVADSGKTDSNGKRYLEWQEGDYKWSLKAASTGLWNIKLVNDPKFAADNFTIGRNVILVENGGASETRWEFVNSG